MRITKLESFLTNGGLRNYLFVRLTTDSGLTGIGEATLEWQEQTVQTLLHEWVEDRILGVDPIAAGERLYMLEDFSRLTSLRACDIVQMDLAHCGGLWIGKMIAALINTARGAIVDEAALVALFQQGKIAGAALDVFEEIDVFATPGTPTSHPLLDLDNVILTPHCAGSSVESSLDSKVRGARNAADVLLGVQPRHIVNPEAIPRFPLVPRSM